MYRGGFRLPEFTSLEEWWGRHLSDYYAAFRCLGGTFDAAADVSPATATNDLAAAVAAGLLRAEGRARSRTYRAGEGLYLRIGAALGVPVDAPADASRAAIIGELTRRATSEGPR